MFEHLADRKILVSGPQRSGTRICSKMVAHDTGLPYIDETEIKELFLGKAHNDGHQKWDEIGKEVAGIVQNLIDTRDFVLHCPPFMPWIHLVEGALVIIMWRSVEEINRSAKRIDWKKGRQEQEYNKLGYTRYGRKKPGYKPTSKSVAELRYEFWEEHQKERIPNYLGVEYHSLQKHPMWVPPNERSNFRWNQTSLPDNP